VIVLAKLLDKATVAIERAKALDAVADPLRSVVKPPLDPRPIKNALSGSWLGHRLHPLLTDVAITCFVGTSLVDLTVGEDGDEAAQKLLQLGVLSVLPTAAAGLSDWVDVAHDREKRIGLVHLGANLVASACYLVSLSRRRNGRRMSGVWWALSGSAALGAGGYLGGHLSYGLGTGVDNTAFEPVIEDWARAKRFQELEDGVPTAVGVEGTEVFLLRRGGDVIALVDRCTHAGGPLHEGAVKGSCIQCPWHGSEFRLDDGSVVRGPAATPQPVYETRVVDNMVEVRRRQP
jgi:nitrite reductase/ring-hydroxylating ferredoxin subunit/uncharacterized membrane protein